jgi:cytochrome b involved in lipid metabolism
VSTSPGAAAYSAADLMKHSNANSCWSAINGNVYDLTKWIALHPGGQSTIKALCGIDGSAMFDNQHGGENHAVSSLMQYKIGKFA